MWRVFRPSVHGGARELIFETSTSACSFYSNSSKKYTWLQYKKRRIQAPGTTFSVFGNEVGMKGGHENCCRFATLTGVHQGAHIRSPYVPCQIMDPWQSSELEQNDGISYKEKLRGRGGYSCRFECVYFIFLWAMQHR